MSRPLTEIRPFSYDLMLLDCPWPWENYSEKGAKKSPSAYYKTMPIEEIAALPVGHWARRDCLLLMWGTVPYMHMQIPLITRWGFEYKSAVVWHKIFPSGKNAIGTGYRVRSMCELLFVATMGEPQQTKALPGLFRGIRREYSRKPEELYPIIDHCCPKLMFRADIFARQERPGYDTFGDEVTKFNEVAA